MYSDLYLHHAVRVASALISKATFFRLREESLSKNECIGLFTRMTDADLYQWLKESPTDYIREYASRIRYRRLFKVVLSRPISAFEKDAQKVLRTLETDIQKLIDVELVRPVVTYGCIYVAVFIIIGPDNAVAIIRTELK